MQTTDNNLRTKNKKVAQHHNLINARYYLDDMKLKIFNILLSHVDKDDKEFRPCKIALSDIFPAYGGREYAKIKTFLDNVTSTTVHIEDLIKGKNGKTKTQLKVYPMFDEAGYIEGEKSFIICLNTKLKPFLLELCGEYCLTEIKYLAIINNFYTQRIYWKLKQIAQFKQKLIDYKELRFLVCLDNLKGEPEKYGDISNFKRKVLDVAKQDLQSTDLTFDYKFVKNKATKEIESISIQFIKNQGEQSVLPFLTPEQTQIQQRLTKNGCTAAQIDWIVFKSGLDTEALNKLCYENELNKKSKPETNQAARLLAKIKQIWAANKAK